MERMALGSVRLSTFAHLGSSSIHISICSPRPIPNNMKTNIDIINECDKYEAYDLFRRTKTNALQLPLLRK